MTVLIAQKNRHFTYDLVLLDSDDAAITPEATDVVRVKVGFRGDSPLLDLDSAAASVNGSTIQLNTPSDGTNLLTIVQADMALLSPGIYSLEAGLVGMIVSRMCSSTLNITSWLVQDVMAGDVGDT